MRKKILLVTIIAVLIARVAECQCPQPGLWSRLHSKDFEHQADKELKKLLIILDSVEHCSFSDDSTYSYLLSRIGQNYRIQGDFLKSVQVYKKAIKVLADNPGSASTNMTHLP